MNRVHIRLAGVVALGEDAVPRRNATSREELLDRALHLVARRGTGAVTVRRLAAETGVAVGTLYGYFPGKDDLLRAAAERLEARFVAALDEACPPEAPLRSRLPAMAAAVTGLAFSSPALTSLLALPAGPATGTAGRRVAGWIAARLRGARERGEIGTDDHDLRAAAAYGLVRAAFEHGLARPDAGRARRDVEEVVAAGLAGLLVAGRAPVGDGAHRPPSDG
ncbi:MAG TPA: TetR/AcrR family transcriptional regulator [Pseudonocardia sp.]|nr:TetR/AcrR family transcriptional regulator [Pseudonocardia sp.]